MRPNNLMPSFIDKEDIKNLRIVDDPPPKVVETRQRKARPSTTWWRPLDTEN